MSIQGQPFTLTYTVLDTTTLAPLDGDVANHTVRVYSDGAGFTPSGTITGIGGGSGEYKLTITGGENAGTAMKAIPKTSTSGKFIAPVLWNNTSSTLVANVQQVATEFSVGSRIAASGVVSAVTDTKTFTVTFSNGTGPAVADQFGGQTLEIYNPSNPQQRASARIVSHGTVDSQPIAFVVETDILTLNVGHSVAIIIDSPSSSGGTVDAASVWAYANRTLTSTVTPSANTNTCNVIVQAQNNDGSARPRAVVEYRNYTPSTNSAGRGLPGAWTQRTTDSTGIASCTAVVNDLYQYRIDGGVVGTFAATSTGSVAISLNLVGRLQS